jgi:hypothetical protein
MSTDHEALDPRPAKPPKPPRLKLSRRAKVRRQKMAAAGAGFAVLVAGGVVIGRMTADEGADRQLLTVPRRRAARPQRRAHHQR